MSDPQQRRRRGCLFYGGLAALVVAVVLFGVYFGFRYAKGVINQLTDTKPMPLPSTRLPQVQVFQLNDRIQTFEDAIRDGDPTGPLELSGDEVNSLISTEPSMASLKNHLYVTIDGDQLHAQVSLPAEELGLVALRGRYINASGVFNVGLTNGQLGITAESLVAKGKPVARHVMRRIAAQNLAAKFNEDPQVAEALKSLKAIEVKDGKLVIVAKK